MARHRWSLVEYDAPAALVGPIARETGLGPARVAEQLRTAGERTARALNFSASPLSIAADRVQAAGFAGLLRAGPAIELEIAPKFLGGGAAGWREDFFFLATLSRHGRLLNAERLRALSGASSDLATLVARALIQMVHDQHRRPIRTYRRRSERGFAIEGEADAEELRVPDEDGFLQTVTRFDRSNPFNAAIRGAAADLLPLVRDAEARASLERVMLQLGPQPALRSARPRRLPSRSRSWQPTYDLAIDVLSGFGLSYAGGQALAPGFVLNTWRVWEDLVTVGLRAHLGGQAVAAQRRLRLGDRRRRSEAGWSIARPLDVVPDLWIDGADAGFGTLLVDAKYKGRWDGGRQRIEEADIYEALAFAQAGGVKKVVLVYPATATATSAPTGTARVLECVEVGEVQVWGVEVEVRGIAAAGGIRAFADGLVRRLRAIGAPG